MLLKENILTCLYSQMVVVRKILSMFFYSNMYSSCQDTTVDLAMPVMLRLVLLIYIVMLC